jgi:RNA polymerase sigma factor (sigma-70 family)
MDACDSADTSPTSGAGFYPSTMWDEIENAKGSGPAAENAWATLLKKYQRPIQVQLARYFKGEEEDLAAEFIAVKLVDDLVPKADAAKGRFRGLLASTLRNFIVDHQRKRLRQKRGSGQKPISLESNPEVGEFVPEACGHELESELDRALAVELFQRAAQRSKSEALKKYSEEAFEMFIGRESGLPVQDIARRLGLTESNAKVIRHRLQNRLREILREEVGQLAKTGDIDAELKYLGTLFGFL